MLSKSCEELCTTGKVVYTEKIGFDSCSQAHSGWAGGSSIYQLDDVAMHVIIASREICRMWDNASLKDHVRWYPGAAERGGQAYSEMHD